MQSSCVSRPCPAVRARARPVATPCGWARTSTSTFNLCVFVRVFVRAFCVFMRFSVLVPETSLLELGFSDVYVPVLQNVMF